MTFRLHIAALLASVALLAVPASADGLVSTDDPLAADALVVFTKACVITKAVPEKIAAKLVEFGATKLPDKIAVELAKGKPGSQGWKLHSLHGAQLWISWVPPRRCSVLVKKAKARALQNGVVQVLQQISLGGEMRFKLEHHDEQKTQGGTEETSEYLMQIVRDQDASVSVTSTESNSADLQGLLTFKVLGVN